MRLFAAAALLGIIPFFAACASAPDEHHYPLILSIVSRHQTIQIHEGPTGPLYTVLDADGTIVVRSQSLESLQAQQPEIYNQIKTLNASDTIDASLATPVQNNSSHMNMDTTLRRNSEIR
jgi:hypothetical protein